MFDRTSRSNFPSQGRSVQNRIRGIVPSHNHWATAAAGAPHTAAPRFMASIRNRWGFLSHEPAGAPASGPASSAWEPVSG